MTPDPRMTERGPLAVRAPDGVTVAVHQAGDPRGSAIVFIHGYSQCHLSWARQMASDLARAFRLVAYDLRGHGSSDKPLEPICYTDPRRWADELQAVIDALGAGRVLLVGWSYGGRVICDYLAHHGEARVAGINFVDAVTASDPALFGAGRGYHAGMASEDLAANIAATRQFLRDCFATPPAADDFATMLAFNMVVPPRVRAAMGGRAAHYDAVLRRVTVPVLVTHGLEDALVLPAMGRHTAAIVRGARASYYPGVGHSPFWEDAPRFNAELAAFAAAAFG